VIPEKNYWLKQKLKDTRERRVKERRASRPSQAYRQNKEKPKRGTGPLRAVRGDLFVLKTKNKLNVDAKPLMES
jgi:hypothetical protein